MNWLEINNRQGAVSLDVVPVLPYDDFHADVCAMLGRDECHVAEYFAVRRAKGVLEFFCIVADDIRGILYVSAHRYDALRDPALRSVSALFPAMHCFEREIAELHGVEFDGDPWPKPLRYPAAGSSGGGSADGYPFYRMQGESLHEVNVGPIHAGIIEPGAFRFICNGERVLHLEIALGYQHRGIEPLMCAAGSALRRVCLVEGIAGDSVVAHTTAHAMLMEKLSGATPAVGLDKLRTIALELERVAMHLADTGALCMDIGYQLGQVACEALRTIVINTTQRICGNRFGKGLIRPMGSNFTIDSALARDIVHKTGEVARRYEEVIDDLKNTPSVLARFEECGVVSRATALRIGAVGMAARASGLNRDVRCTHPWGVYDDSFSHEGIARHQGDVMARLMVRAREVFQSITYVQFICELMAEQPEEVSAPDYDLRPLPGMLAVAMVEGWRGEICHAAVTDYRGRLACYKVKDPSMHNWLALALAVRGAGISDFPVCNKSFNLSYCGHDL